MASKNFRFGRIKGPIHDGFFLIKEEGKPNIFLSHINCSSVFQGTNGKRVFLGKQPKEKYRVGNDEEVVFEVENEHPECATFFAPLCVFRDAKGCKKSAKVSRYDRRSAIQALQEEDDEIHPFKKRRKL